MKYLDIVNLRCDSHMHLFSHDSHIFRELPAISHLMLLITPPARRAWRSYKFAPFLFFFSVSKVGAPLMGDTAVHSLSHDFKLNF